MIMTNCSSPPNASPQAPSLEGTSWVLSSLLGGAALVGEQRITAQFADGRVSGSDGCNRYAAPVTLSGSSINVGPRGPSTLMACPPAVMRQADAFLAAMIAARSYQVVDGRLELLGGDRAVLATFEAQSTSLVGTTWSVVALNNGRGAVTGIESETSLTMLFAADGKVSGSGGCNQYTANWTQEGSSLRFSPAASTRRMCPGEGIMEQEQAFFTAMQTVATMRFEGDRLEMRTADDALALMLTRSGS
jgi:heat shock protein HslJ